jgi:DNA invertase Pin-like site-specific DNA recombinase
MKQKYAAVYVRSAARTQDGDEGYRLQREACLDKAEQEEYKVVEEIIDLSVSGINKNRSGLLKLNELIRGKKIDAVIVRSPDRLLIELQKEFVNNSIELLYANF